MKKLILVLVLITWGCNPMKMIHTSKGKIYRYQKDAVFNEQYQGVQPVKIP
ncbi:hypothetical protein LCGC14_1791940 [marine sediment metagenome]|uniref:Uncharacterized protein n=1 Tax=marine sediment metagenome TaxID=412755 RepID=A0A0F9HEV3_9ZZZZ